MHIVPSEFVEEEILREIRYVVLAEWHNSRRQKWLEIRIRKIKGRALEFRCITAQ